VLYSGWDTDVSLIEKMRIFWCVRHCADLEIQTGLFEELFCFCMCRQFLEMVVQRMVLAGPSEGA